MKFPAFGSLWIESSNGAEQIVRIDAAGGGYIYTTALTGPDVGTRYEQGRVALGHFQPGGMFRPYTGRLVTS